MNNQPQSNLIEMTRFQVGELIEVRGIGFHIRSISETALVLEQADCQYAVAQWRAFGEAILNHLLASQQSNSINRIDIDLLANKVAAVIKRNLS